MKRLAVIFGILFLSLTAFSQFQINARAFKAYEVKTFNGWEKSDGSFAVTSGFMDPCNELFYFKDAFLFTSLKENQRAYKFVKPYSEYCRFDSRLNGAEPGYLIACTDYENNASHVVVYHNGENDYTIVLEYSDTRRSYKCKLTNERPWDNDPIDYVAEGMKYRTNPEYTEEDLENFADKLSGFFGKTITKGMMVAWSWNTINE